MTNTTRIGFIGLGIMGRPMARNLLKAGYPVTVWNRSRPGIDALVAEGSTEATSPAHVAEQSDVVITMVGDHTDVEQVSLGTTGIVEAARPGLVHIDMSTISPEITRRIAAALETAGMEMLDAPVSGGEPGAINAALSIMAGGKVEIFELCLPVLEALGKKVVYCGPSGSGQVVKLCNQIVGALNNLAVCEAITLCINSGVDPRKMLDAVGAGAAASWMVTNLGPRMLEEDFRAGFKVEHQLKDLRYALETAAATDLNLPGTILTEQAFAELTNRGLGAEGTQALIKYVRS